MILTWKYLVTNSGKQPKNCSDYSAQVIIYMELLKYIENKMYLYIFVQTKLLIFAIRQFKSAMKKFMRSLTLRLTSISIDKVSKIFPWFFLIMTLSYAKLIFDFLQFYDVCLIWPKFRSWIQSHFKLMHLIILLFLQEQNWQNSEHHEVNKISHLFMLEFFIKINRSQWPWHKE